MRKYWISILMFSPLAYPLAAAVQGVVEPFVILRMLAIALIVAGCSYLGSRIAVRAPRYFNNSQFWADEAGLLIAINGFLTPMIVLSSPSGGLDEHLAFVVLLATSCLAGIAAIVSRDQPTGKRAT